MSNLLRVITNSERNSFACNRRWGFKYKDGLTPMLTPAPLRHGTLWHSCLAAYYRSKMGMTAEEINEAVIQPWLESRLAWTLTNNTAREPFGQSDENDELEDDSIKAKLMFGMMQGYIRQWKAQDERYEVVHVEVEVARQIVVPRFVKGAWVRKPLTDMVQVGAKRQKRLWTYGGALDMVVRDREDGTFWQFEHKSCKDTDLQKYMRKLHWDPQIRGYAWAARDPWTLAGTGTINGPLKIEGVIYNVARKKLPREPAMTQKGWLERGKVDTTREVYMQAITRHGLNPDLYADQLEQLRGRTFFAREPYVFTEPDLDDFEQDMVDSALRVQAEEKVQTHPRQTAVCTGIAAPRCPYEQICLVDGPMARMAFRVMGIRHEELTGDFAETYVAKMRGVTGSQQNNAMALPKYGVHNDPFQDLNNA